MGLEGTLPALLDALGSAGIGVIALRHADGNTQKLYGNKPATMSLGYTPEEWLAIPLWTRLAPDQKRTISQLFERVIQRDDIPAPNTLEVRFVHRDGHEVRFEVVTGRAVVPGGHVIVCVMAERGLHRQAQLSLLEADRLSLVGALAAGFAHETNNPLTSVLLNLRSLRKLIVSNMTDTAQMNALRCLDDITTGSERIAANVRALQTLATRSSSQTIDLASVVSSALRLAAPTLEPRAHVIRQIFPVAPVLGEESRVGQAVLAMLLFSSSGFDGELSVASNRIVVAVEDRDHHVVVEVSDNGRDLSADEAERAFDPFFRSPVRGAGVGVGLGVARSVAIALGGDFNLTRRLGGGAVITMRLPAAPQPDEPIRA